MTKHYGIIGYPAKSSFSPVMHNAAFKAEGIDADYKVFEIDPEDPEELANFCYESDLNELAGFSVTSPFKVTVMDYLDFYDPLAKKLNAVNTVKNEHSNLNGHNTDAIGAMQALQEQIQLPGKKVLVLGAGGAAKAIVYGLKEFGADIYIWNRTPEKADALAEMYDVEVIDFRNIQKIPFDLIINTTVVGSKQEPGQSLLTAEQIPEQALVMDIVTDPLDTPLLHEARKAGAQVISGERMLLHQAAGQFEIWFEKTAPIKVMEEALYEEIERRKN